MTHDMKKVHKVADRVVMLYPLSRLTPGEPQVLFDGPTTRLVDFDTVYGHRNDVQGYADNVERFDVRLARLLPQLGGSDILIVTADHGNDPTTPSTDHSREHVPLFVCGASIRTAVDVGVRRTFADLGKTLAELFGVGPLDHGMVPNSEAMVLNLGPQHPSTHGVLRVLL